MLSASPRQQLKKTEEKNKKTKESKNKSRIGEQSSFMAQTSVVYTLVSLHVMYGRQKGAINKPRIDHKTSKENFTS